MTLLSVGDCLPCIEQCSTVAWCSFPWAANEGAASDSARSCCHGYVMPAGPTGAAPQSCRRKLRVPRRRTLRCDVFACAVLLLRRRDASVLPRHGCVRELDGLSPALSDVSLGRDLRAVPNVGPGHGLPLRSSAGFAACGIGERPGAVCVLPRVRLPHVLVLHPSSSAKVSVAVHVRRGKRQSAALRKRALCTCKVRLAVLQSIFCCICAHDGSEEHVHRMLGLHRWALQQGLDQSELTAIVLMPSLWWCWLSCQRSLRSSPCAPRGMHEQLHRLLHL